MNYAPFGTITRAITTQIWELLLRYMQLVYRVK